MFRKLPKRLERRRILWTRSKRLVGASTPVFVTAVLTMIAAIIGATAQAPTSVASEPHQIVVTIPWWIWILAILGFSGLMLRAFFEYQRRTHDPALALKLQEQFGSENFIELRKLAIDALTSGELLASRGLNLQDIDPVLDFLEELGFYERGGQLSAEVVHHHFFHWARVSWQIARPYAVAWQDKKPTRWEYINDMFEILQEIEVERAEAHLVPTKKWLDDGELNDFIEGERQTWASIQLKP